MPANEQKPNAHLTTAGHRGVALLLPLAFALVAACGGKPAPGGSPAEHGALSLPALLSSLDGEFTPVGEMPELAFPDDHAAHPEYRTEAWVLTGLLAEQDGTRSALQLTILRVRLGGVPDIESDWAAGDVFAAAAVLARGSAGGVQVAERVSRAAAGLAGTRREPPSIWVEDWRLAPDVAQSGTAVLAGGIDVAGLRLALELSSDLPAVTPADVSGEDSRASGPFAFYTQPGLTGTATLGDAGSASEAAARFVLEHAWGELPLPGSPVARDRFTLFLDDGSQLVLVRSHRADGSGRAETQGLYVADNGDVQPLDADAIELDATDDWQSPRTGARYPVEWRLRIAKLGIDLRLEPLRRDSEGVSWAPFWMGPVDLISSSRTSGGGTMALNGYEAAIE